MRFEKGIAACERPELRAYRNLSPYITEAQAYLALALTTRSVEQRREYAYLGVAAANTAILATPATQDAKVVLLPYPTERQLTNYPYMAALADKMYKLDVTLLIPTLKAHDKNWEGSYSSLPSAIAFMISATWSVRWPFSLPFFPWA
ncbi:MAG: hypothetical protein ACJ8EB_13100 [Allosphingosinicella sp.]